MVRVEAFEEMVGDFARLRVSPSANLLGHTTVEVRIEDRLGCVIATASSPLSSWTDLLVTSRERLDLGALCVEAAPGWSGYWFRVDDACAAKISPKAFRSLIESIEEAVRAASPVSPGWLSEIQFASKLRYGVG